MTLKVLVRKIVVFPIVLYQKTLSPDHGIFKFFYPHGYCKYYPTCSEYCKKSIEKKGIIKGILLGSWRILRCNPWSKGGIDNVR